MKINLKSVNKSSLKQNFGAQLKITEPWKGFVEKDLVDDWIQKAKTIGLENDVIEIKFGKIKKEPKEYFSGQDNFYAYFGEKYKQKITVTANINGKQRCKYKDEVSDNSSVELDKLSNPKIEKILDSLHDEFGNDIYN